MLKSLAPILLVLSIMISSPAYAQEDDESYHADRGQSLLMIERQSIDIWSPTQMSSIILCHVMFTYPLDSGLQDQYQTVMDDFLKNVQKRKWVKSAQQFPVKRSPCLVQIDMEDKGMTKVTLSNGLGSTELKSKTNKLSNVDIEHFLSSMLKEEGIVSL